ncbi:hypothetical protein Q6240_34215, partial [Klebsiella pneumoniae]|nr:hypothetical protein [Klebsiella pneumoniae]
MKVEQLFIRPHTRTPGVPLRWITPAEIVTQQALLRHPDFVVARMKVEQLFIRPHTRTPGVPLRWITPA